MAEDRAYVHPSAVVDEGAQLGPGVKVWHFAHVSSGARIGAGTVLGQGVYVGPGVEIGRGCKVQNHVSVYEGVSLADDVFVGPSAVFTNVVTPRAHVSRRGAYAPTRVGRQATIGANATVVCGVSIGERAFVGAGAVVTRDVLAGVLVVGAPARPAGHACACGAILPRSAGGLLVCSGCGARWHVLADGSAGPETRS